MTLGYIIVAILIAVIFFLVWYYFAQSDYKPEIWRLKTQLDSVIDRYNKDINDVKSLNENLRSVNSKLKADVNSFKSELIELRVKAKELSKKKMNKTDDEDHTPKKKGRPAKK